MATDMQCRYSRTKPAEAGFSLVEMMLSLAVLLFIAVGVVQLLNTSTTATTLSRKRLDADSQARVVFDRLAADFDQMLKRADVDYIFFKNVPTSNSAINDAIFFYSRAPAYFDFGATDAVKGAVRLTGYRINNNLQLERLGKGLSWDASPPPVPTPIPPPTPSPGGVIFLSNSSPTPIPATTLVGGWPSTIGSAVNNYSDGIDPDYIVIGDEVCRFEIVFVLSDGTCSQYPVRTTAPSSWANTAGPATYYRTNTADPTINSDSNSAHSITYAKGSRWLSTSTNTAYICTDASVGAAKWTRIGIQDISSVVVAIAILDNTSNQLVTNRANITNALPDPTQTNLQSSPPVLMAQTWQATVENGTFAQTTGLPVTAASQVRVYQRQFAIQ